MKHFCLGSISLPCQFQFLFIRANWSYDLLPHPDFQKKRLVQKGQGAKGLGVFPHYEVKLSA